MMVFEQHRFSPLTGVLALLCLLLSVPAAAQRDDSQDRVFVSFGTGKVTHRIEIAAFEHEVVVTRDAASGLPTGKRQHKPLSVTKHIDKSTPLLMQALLDNTVLDYLRIEVFHVDRKGVQRPVRRVDLDEPTVCAVGNSLSVEDRFEREHISFCYQKIIWTWNDGGITAEDDWEEPRI